jgi:hypothetical protein
MLIKTKKELKALCSKMLGKLNIGDSVPKKQLALMIKMVNHHSGIPDEIKAKTIDVVIGFQNGNNCFAAKTSDGIVHPFSYAKAIMNKEQYYNKKKTEAYRFAIKDQIENFRLSNVPRCFCCGEEAYIVHVHHDCKKFKKLCDDFEYLHIDADKSIGFVAEGPCKDQCVFNNKQYEAEWQKYHEEHATLKILCSKCHMKSH